MIIGTYFNYSPRICSQCFLSDFSNYLTQERIVFPLVKALLRRMQNLRGKTLRRDHRSVIFKIRAYGKLRMSSDLSHVVYLNGVAEGTQGNTVLQFTLTTARLFSHPYRLICFAGTWTFHPFSINGRQQDETAMEVYRVNFYPSEIY